MTAAATKPPTRKTTPAIDTKTVSATDSSSRGLISRWKLPEPSLAERCQRMRVGAMSDWVSFLRLEPDIAIF